MQRVLRLTTGLVLLGFLCGRSTADDAYRAEVEAWRQEREARLRAEDGWLTLVGLHWLDTGPTRLGSGVDNDVRLPAGAPDRVGVLERSGDRVEFHPEPGIMVLRGCKSFAGGEIRTDAEGDPDVLSIGSIRFLVIRRGDRHALRVKDSESPVRAGFAGVRWFPIDEAWRIPARFEPADIPTRIVMDTIVDTSESFESPGSVVFTRDGKNYRLQAAAEGDKLWFVFRDATAGRATPENGRQLMIDMPGPDGAVVVDFNRAVNLPCAYTPFATCPLPPRQNRIDLAIPAGERIDGPAGRASPAR